MTGAQTFIDKIVDVIINPIITLLIALAFVLFLWGSAQFVLNVSGTTEREKGKQHMLWGIIGLFIMFGVFGLLRILANTIGFCDTLPIGC